MATAEAKPGNLTSPTAQVAIIRDAVELGSPLTASSLLPERLTSADKSLSVDSDGCDSSCHCEESRACTERSECDEAEPL